MENVEIAPPSPQTNTPRYVYSFLWLYSIIILSSPILYLFFVFGFANLFMSGGPYLGYSFTDIFEVSILAVMGSLILSVIAIRASINSEVPLNGKWLRIAIFMPIVIILSSILVLIYWHNQIHKESQRKEELYFKTLEVFAQEAHPLFQRIKTELPWITYTSCDEKRCDGVKMYSSKEQLSDDDLTRIKSFLSEMLPIKDKFTNSKLRIYPKGNLNTELNVELVQENATCEDHKKISYLCKIINPINCVEKERYCQ